MKNAGIAIANFLIRVRNLVVHEFPLLLGAAIAAADASTDKSVKGYAVAASVAALRFVVSPAFEKAAVKEHVIDPELIARVAAMLREQGYTPPAPTDGTDAP